MIKLSSYVNAKRDLVEEIPSTFDALEPYFEHDHYTIKKDEVHGYIHVTKNNDGSMINIKLDAITDINLNFKDMISTIRTKHGYLHLFMDDIMVGMV